MIHEMKLKLKPVKLEVINSKSDMTNERKMAFIWGRETIERDLIEGRQRMHYD